jgi:ornithine decarboxylase
LATRIFNIQRQHRKLISESTLLKVLTYIDARLGKKGVFSKKTPVLLLDREQIEKKAASIGKGIRNSRTFYAVKANPSPGIIKLLKKTGMGFEIASEGELELVVKEGIGPERIITSNPVKTFKFLSMAAARGIKYFAFDSFEEVDKMARFTPGANVYVRLSVPNEGSEWPLSRKFGIEVEQAVPLLIYAKKKKLNPVGLTFHVGSQCTNASNWNMALYKARTLWDGALASGIKMSLLNIGGGYPINYTKNVIQIGEIEENIDALIRAQFPPETRIFIEPGRAMVGDAGIFVTSVHGKAERADGNWLYVDVGVFNGMMEALGGIKYSYIVEAPRTGMQKKLWTVSGPSCDSFDVIDTNVPLTEPEAGALVLILSAGAYTVSYASEFNGFSILKTVLI